MSETVFLGRHCAAPPRRNERPSDAEHLGVRTPDLPARLHACLLHLEGARRLAKTLVAEWCAW